MENILLKSMDENTDHLLKAIGSFTAAQFNMVPFEGSWTVGQIVEHVLKSESGLPTLLLGHTKAANRNTAEKVPEIEGIFLDFTTKLQSPENILPSNGFHNQQILYEAVKNNRAEIRKLAPTVNLGLLLVDYPFPTMGTLTGIEWLAFIQFHSKRHIHQMDNIRQLFN